MKNEVTARRLSTALNRIDMKAQELADRSGLNKASISQYINGTHAPSNISAGKMASVLGVNPVWLMGYDVPMFESAFNVVSSSGTVRIPVYGSVSAGPGCFAEGNIEGFVEIPEDMAKHGEFFGLKVRGDSMEPDIKEGDVVIVKKQDDLPSEGKTVVAIVNGDEGFCKRLAKYAEGLGLVSNNPSYMPKYYSSEEVRNLPVKIIGVVVRLIRDF